MSHPEVETARGRGEDGVFGVNQHLGVFLGGRLVDEEVVFADRGGIVRDEALVPVEQLLAVGEVLPDAHVRVMRQSCGEVKQSVLQRVETHDAVERTLLVYQRTVADDDFGAGVVTVHHAAQPLLVDGHAVAVGEDDEVVFGRLDAHGKWEFLAIEEVKVLLELHRLHPRLVTLQVFQVFLGLVVGTVVHHDDFEVRVVLLEQGGNQLGEVFVGVAGTKHDGDRLQLLVELRARVPFIKGDFRENAPMVEQLDDKANAKND